ncbi:PhnD/SsuA/transferrin family substrate-binding protein [Candidatus Sumerlaeota bacterium]|nr:PhnD/SsuA/transferrin family substrate-binding protein [Candidatus Sumerlaeota bacterium]
MAADDDTLTSPAASDVGENAYPHGITTMQLTGVNLKDAQTAISLWMTSIEYDRRGSEGKFYHTYQEIYQALLDRKVDTVTIHALEYVALPDRSIVEPYAVQVRGEAAEMSYVLLASVKNGVSSLANLKGKRMLIETGIAGMAGAVWLDVILKRENLPEAEQFLGRIELAQKSSETILPVFFGQMDACVVSRTSYNVMNELNPQIGKRLTILAESKPLLEGLTGFSRLADIPDDQRKTTIDATMNLGDTPEGRQIMTLFRVNKIEAWNDNYLNNLKELAREYEQSTGKKIDYWLWKGYAINDSPSKIKLSAMQ